MGKFVEHPAASEPEKVGHGSLYTLGQTFTAEGVGYGDSDINVGVDDLGALDEDVGIGFTDRLADGPTLRQEIL